MPYCSIDEAWGNDFGVQSEENLVDPRLGALKNKYSFSANDKRDIYKRYSHLRKRQNDMEVDSDYGSEPASLSSDSLMDCDYDEGQSELPTCHYHFKHLRKCPKCSKKVEMLAKKYKVEGMNGEDSKPLEFTIRLPSNTSELLAFFIIGITIIYVIEWIFRRRG